ncbi:MAG: MBL fold metallo-hydrolase, partial [Alistipes sp.]|nr:MBL fold metallo-hydrolase [Alistipes sp.]
KGVDVAFLPVNQPYTMTVEQAARVVAALKPQIFYPYHYGQVDEKTDIEALKSAVEGVTEIRVFPME